MIAEQTLHTHGHVILEQVMGSDIDIVNAARISFNTDTDLHISSCDSVSFGQGECTCNNLVYAGNAPKLDSLSKRDAGLINYLMRERHGTPFEMVELKFDIKAPIFVFREWHRHRTASINEMSGRYTELLNEFYLPEPDAVRRQVGKPGSYSYESVTEDERLYHFAPIVLRSTYAKAWTAYQDLLDEGCAKEVARLVLPVATYSRMKWKVNLRNLLGFLNLRNAPNAQREIRDYAAIMEAMIKPVFPVTMAAFESFGRVKP